MVPYPLWLLLPISDNRESGFSAEAPANALQTLSTESTDYKPVIEEDKVVTINGDFETPEHPL